MKKILCVLAITFSLITQVTAASCYCSSSTWTRHGWLSYEFHYVTNTDDCWPGNTGAIYNFGSVSAYLGNEYIGTLYYGNAWGGTDIRDYLSCSGWA